MDEQTTVNAVQESVEGSQPQEQEQSVTSEVASPKPVQDAETNAQYARLRREAEQKAKDSLIAELSAGQYKNYADYQRALERQRVEQEAHQKGLDPEVYQKINDMESKLSFLEREKSLLEQDRKLETDPKVGDFYKQWKSEVHDLANRYQTDLDTALTLLTREKLSDILNSTKSKVEQETIQKLQQNAESSTGSLSQGATANKTNVWQMSKAEFEAMQERVMRGEKN